MTSGAASHFPSVSFLIRTRMWSSLFSEWARGKVQWIVASEMQEISFPHGKRCSFLPFCLFIYAIMIVLLHVFGLFGKGESLTFILLFSNTWESLRTHFRVGACLVLDIFPNSTLGPQCSRDFYYTASTALGKLKVIFSTCVLLLLDRTPVFLALLNRLTFKAVGVEHFNRLLYCLHLMFCSLLWNEFKK